MKTSISLLLAILICMPFANQAQTAKSRIAFEKTQHNFGTFKEELGAQTVSFNFKNEGTVPLILNNVQASCGCTTPEWTREPIAPGAKGVIKVSYDPRNRPGVFNKTIRVSSNAENPDVVLSISGEVSPRARTIEEDYPNEIGSLRAKTNHVAFPQIKDNEIKKDSVEIINNSDQPVELSFKTPPPHLTAVFNPAKLAPKQKGYIVVTFDASKIKAYGFVMHRLYLNIDGQNDYRNSIAVSTTMTEDFSKLTAEELKNAPVVNYDLESFDFGDIKPNTKNEHIFNLKNAGKRDLIIRDIKSSCGCTAVSPSKSMISANESVPIKVVFDSTGKSGRQNKTITVITNDPKNPTTILRISSNILAQ
ncbi:MAG TPA: DUF1573 domain-containing protein [Prolixibacteraceae bacterium]|nr:DUF1573 domain-containing protein [Prolixibacteraceae bacterium]